MILLKAKRLQLHKFSWRKLPQESPWNKYWHWRVSDLLRF